MNELLTRVGGGAHLALIDPEPAGLLAWQDEALCAQIDTEVFFPELGQAAVQAKRICAGCAVRAECLAYALDHDERYGIWGGKSERERRRLKGRVLPAA